MAGIPGQEAMFSMAGTMPGGMPGMPTADGSFMPGMPSTMGAVDTMAAVAQMQQFYQYIQQQSLGLTAAAGTMPPLLPGMATPYAVPHSPDPAINVSVDGMKFQYQLTEDDLYKVFSRYGNVKTIRVDEAGTSAVITFNALQDAQAAMTDLNGKVLNGLDGTLRITWLSQGAGAFPTPPYPPMPLWGFPPAGVAPALAGAAPAGTPLAPGGAVAGGIGADKSPHTKGVRKYTCRFLIGIDNDKDFQVARRIIGAKGANMKRIVKMSEAKLRLRGIGSGYFEGAGQKESQEPLQLCISCTSPEGYRTAVQQVDELLKRVYEEYKMFCRDNGMPVPDLQINLSENQLVYSSRGTGGAGAGTSGGGSKEGPAAGGDDGSPKKGRRRARGGKREGRTASGELDRGEPGPNAPSVEEIEKFIDERNEARRANNFPEADRIREMLHKRGVALMDEPGGRGRGAEVTTWRYWRD
mmetsp:Transcript_118250/g.339245  ORF Transcript_118250/g.339245 Transcript_118250/m.339245 type:complete len:467 (+) Transcript_118250:180-1580(+)